VLSMSIIEKFVRRSRDQDLKFDLVSEFPLFTPGSFGDHASLSRLTALSVQQTIDALPNSSIR
jgi:hypothetical protein